MVRRMRLLLRKHWLFFRVVEHVWIGALVWRSFTFFFLSFCLSLVVLIAHCGFSYVFGFWRAFRDG
jgi:hypothetical protein